MIYAKGSIEDAVNHCSLQEMEEAVPMTRLERSCLRKWVKSGHDIDTNPWRCYEPDGSDMNYLKAYRILYGVSHGPWDSWEYSTYIQLDSSGKYGISH